MAPMLDWLEVEGTDLECFPHPRKPETPNPKPQTPNPKPGTRNPKPETRNLEAKTPNPQHPTHETLTPPFECVPLSGKLLWCRAPQPPPPLIRLLILPSGALPQTPSLHTYSISEESSLPPPSSPLSLTLFLPVSLSRAQVTTSHSITSLPASTTQMPCFSAEGTRCVIARNIEFPISPSVDPHRPLVSFSVWNKCYDSGAFTKNWGFQASDFHLPPRVYHTHAAVEPRGKRLTGFT